MTTTAPSGRRLGRKPDSSDPRDKKFLSVHPKAATIPLPPAVDLRHPIAPCFDQGDLGSCGAQAGAALMSYLYPEVRGGFSRLQLYYDVRKMEKSISEDSGVETRDVLKAMAEVGVVPETRWPYDVKKFTQAPPAETYSDPNVKKISSYSRLVSGSNYLQCLASGYPFLLGVELHESFDSDQTDKTGIMPIPGKDENAIGGHDVLVVGYILNFKSDPLFLKSGVDPALVSDEMLIVRNSWGTDWSHYYRGNFFMPLQYALDKVTGNDAWTGRR